MLRISTIFKNSNRIIFNTRKLQFSTNSTLTEREKEKDLMRQLYKNKESDLFFSDQLNNLIKSYPAFIAYRGDIRMDYLAKALNDYDIPITVVNLDLNPVFNEAFESFYPFIHKTGYAVFLKGRIAETDELLIHIEKGTLVKYLKSNNLL